MKLYVSGKLVGTSESKYPYKCDKCERFYRTLERECTTEHSADECCHCEEKPIVKSFVVLNGHGYWTVKED